jgi:hypothetical protein
MAETTDTCHHHRQIVWLDDEPEERHTDSDLIERFIARFIDLVRELGQKSK